MTFRTVAAGALVTVFTLIPFASTSAHAFSGQAPPADHVLQAGEVLALGQSVTSSNGRFRFVFRRDGNLVIHQGGKALWTSGTSGEGADRLVMQYDGNLVMFRPLAYGSQPVWSSRSDGFDGAVLSVQEEGGAVIRLHDGPVLWSAGLPAPDVGLAGVKHVVYGRGDQLMWLVDADGTLFDSYPVSGRATWPLPGRYEAFSKSRHAWALYGGITMEYMVRFVRPTVGVATGFHSIPVTRSGTPIQTVDELGQFRSSGCVRQRNDKAEQLYDWAPIGTPVVVLA